MTNSSPNIQKFIGQVSREDREQRNGHKSSVFWLTGLSGSGKSTIAHEAEKALYDKGIRSYVFDGDNVRHGLCKNLGFSPEDRAENLRRISEVASLFVANGTVCFCAFIAPLHSDRELIRSILGDDYHEIFVSCPLEVCETRDVKGYYKRARAGEIKNYTGISAPYDVPVEPDLVVHTEKESVAESVQRVLEFIDGIITL
ncbi:MAG: adenylyl-sulfate kinase [Desulfovibrio sp.]|uniref:adenylyl-sulfate kinase n=1 Tax=Desulfovibrio sp. 7SRBS1 TaxID=3378064 RepID=UPI003B3F175C